MISTLDLADLIIQAQTSDGKVIIADDTGQLQAIQNGGGMLLLADVLGYARLAEPVRFRAAWEQATSLRLRDGDPEQMLDAAAVAYVANTLDGKDALLMAADPPPTSPPER